VLAPHGSIEHTQPSYDGSIFNQVAPADGVQENMEKNEKIKILSELAAMYPEVRHVVGAIGEEQFLHMSYDIVANFVPPEEFVDNRTAEALADTHTDLCMDAWYNFRPYFDRKFPSKADIGYALIISACCHFERELDEAWDGEEHVNETTDC